MFDSSSRTPYDLRFSLFGIPVQVHPFFWLTTLFLGMGLGDTKAIICWAVAVFIAILVHELGHALIIRYIFGARPWIVLYGLGGLAMHQPTYTIRRPKTLGRILISFGGPLAGFLLAVICLLLVVALSGKMNIYFLWILEFIIVIGIFWGIVNLLPVLPLDGGNICREICLWFSPWRGEAFALQISILTAVVVAVLSYVRFQQLYIAIMFGLFAVFNYQSLYGGRRY